jgi:hypothetical protein
MANIDMPVRCVAVLLWRFKASFRAPVSVLMMATSSVTSAWRLGYKSQSDLQRSVHCLAATR